MLTGVVLLAFAFGWALLTVLSVQLSYQPQRWAAAPAVFLTVARMVLLDSTAPVVGPAPATSRSDDFVGRISMLVAATANLGAAHLLGDSYDSLASRSRDEARASVSTARSVQSYIDEFREGASTTTRRELSSTSPASR